MKVVLFCGGMGMRLRDYSDTVPKPMVNIGYRPVLWNVMKYYAHHGHKDFILCLGYKGDSIKKYFIEYSEFLSNDFTMTGGGKNFHLYHSDINDWTITFADTGFSSNIGQRLLAARKYLEEDEMFLANYSDGLTDFPLDDMLNNFSKSDNVGCFLSVRPNQSYHLVSMEEDGRVNGIHGVARTDTWINGGFFAFKKTIFDYINPGEELVIEPFQRLIELRKLYTFRYDGFWMAMETFKDKQQFDDMFTNGNTPWEVWRTGENR